MKLGQNAACGDAPIVPVILSGGSGTRLWPLSTTDYPKQFLALTDDQTMLQLTAQRTHQVSGFAPPLIVANGTHVDAVEAQLASAGITPGAILLEPVARHTAPAIALAALAIADRTALMLVMPSDHVIADVAAFLAAIAHATPSAAEGWLVTFGITPEHPETGYGYIRIGDRLAVGVHRVDRFVEKPDRATAEAMIVAGGYAWNSGIFLFRVDAYLAALGRHAPDMLAVAQSAMAKANTLGLRIFPDAAHFAQSPANSIDYAIMERDERVAVVPVAMGWSDVGSWDALHAISAPDSNGNVHSGDVVAIESRNCFVKSDNARVTLVGVEDIIVVASGDEILILPRGRSQEIRKAIEALKENDRRTSW